MKRQYPKLKPHGEADNKLAKNQIRHTHSTIAGLEDAIALLWDVVDDAARSILRMRSIIKRVLIILKITRAGPHSYDARNLRSLRKNQKYKKEQDE